MTNVALGGQVQMLAAPLPYRAGPLSRFLAWLEAPPAWRPWVVLAALTFALVAWAHGVLWATGTLAPGTIDIAAIILVFYIPYPLATGVIGRRILRTAVGAFWPATGWPESDRATWLYRFLNVPLRHEVAAVLVGLFAGTAATISVPTGALGSESARFADDVALGPMIIGGYIMISLSVVTVVNWLRLVAAIHEAATAIDPFDRGPVYAFSRLTVFVGLLIVAGTYYTWTVNAAFVAGNVPAQSLLPFTSVLGAAAFVVPLWGIHGRLVRKKDELMRDVDRRIRAAGTELYGRVDARAFEESKSIHDSIAALVMIRDRIRELPTWPWPPQLLRGFISALLLPVIVYLLSRAVAGFVSL